MSATDSLNPHQYGGLTDLRTGITWTPGGKTEHDLVKHPPNHDMYYVRTKPGYQAAIRTSRLGATAPRPNRDSPPPEYEG